MPPGHTPGDLQFLAFLGGLFPNPPRARRKRPYPTPELLIDLLYVFWVHLFDSQPRPQGFSLKKRVGREKALASAGHVSPRTP